MCLAQEVQGGKGGGGGAAVPLLPRYGHPISFQSSFLLFVMFYI